MAEIQAEQENAEELKLGPVFDKETAQPLTNSEALALLNALQTKRKDLDSNYVPAPMVQQTKQYLERFQTIKTETASDAVRDALSEGDVIKPFELCSIVNLQPGTAEEAKGLIPSLETIGDRFHDDDVLQAFLDRASQFNT